MNARDASYPADGGVTAEKHCKPLSQLEIS